jgi:hypothetical protein
MAIAFQQKAYATATTGFTFTALSEPAGTVSGDFLIALVLVNQTSHIITRPTGWTNLYNLVSPASTGSVTAGFCCDVSYIIRGGSAPSLSWTAAAGGTIQYWEGHILGFTGVDNVSPIDANSAAGTTGTGTTAPDPPAATAIGTNDMAIALGIQWAGANTTWTAPTGYTLRSDNTAGNDGIMASKLLSSSGSEDPSAFTTGVLSSSDFWNGATVLLKAASGGATASATPGLRRFPLGV